MGVCVGKEPKPKGKKKEESVVNHPKVKPKPAKKGGAFPTEADDPPEAQGKKEQRKEEGQFNRKKLEKLFMTYKDNEEDYPDWEGVEAIGPDGIIRFCKDLHVDPEDVVLLVFAQKLDASEMGFFTKEEFMEGLEKYGVDSLEKVKEFLSKIKEELNDPVKFREIYRFAFNFAKDEEEKRCLDLEMALGMINLLLVDNYPLAKSFVEYMGQQDTYKGLNSDQWMSLFEFCKTINPDFSNYDENEAWPCMLDEWVDWTRRGSASAAPVDDDSSDSYY
eukprot:CAMPEP_0174250592 /NCGR_PEP_ID=MMETSP0439-20130205/723_1 /TAXON_ID=0 /ORGANISM="Stereomyxa ramosa, Strain Chinc5" /LENGTH=275 /DNA_ID=CAMNT_0015330713 /DNA_START=41 /DNA_END=868 /DNA_ORIENTATION=+